MHLSNLNRRHKVGLFFVLVATGLSLLLEATTGQSLGVLLLGLALAWFLGSASVRFLGIVACLLVCAAGLVLSALPIRNDWESYRINAQDYDAAIADQREAAVKAGQFDPDEFMATRKPNGSDDELAKYRRPAPSTPPKKHVYDTSRLDAVEHPCLGTLKFPHDMPDEERNQLIEEAEKKSCKAVGIPESTQKWMLPGDELEKYKVFPFRNSATPEEIVTSIQSKELLPRPSFSTKAAIAKHLMPFSIGTALTLLGSLGCVWLLSRRAAPPQNT